jgi:subtilisin family serine protease
MTCFKENRNTSRRNVLKVGGAAIGGLTVGSFPVGGSSVGRYLMKPKAGADLSSVTVEEELPEIDFVAVSGRKEDVKSNAFEYAPDPILELNEPTVNSHVPDTALDSVDEPLYELQWDKQDLSVPEAHTVTRGKGIRVAVIDAGIAANHPDLDNVNLELSKNFSGDGLGVGYPYGGYHGTHVSGIIAANDKNDTGVLGTLSSIPVR